mmetsp:Transcript_72981/g.147760  ORF Transcript_72981/g.147760 Transcript_72981/m.147760 type:complete len:230 (-) Transcript_72981:1507-2196(-)
MPCQTQLALQHQGLSISESDAEPHCQQIEGKPVGWAARALFQATALEQRPGSMSHRLPSGLLRPVPRAPLVPLALPARLARLVLRVEPLPPGQPAVPVVLLEVPVLLVLPVLVQPVQHARPLPPAQRAPPEPPGLPGPPEPPEWPGPVTPQLGWLATATTNLDAADPGAYPLNPTGWTRSRRSFCPADTPAAPATDPVVHHVPIPCTTCGVPLYWALPLGAQSPASLIV